MQSQFNNSQYPVQSIPVLTYALIVGIAGVIGAIVWLDHGLDSDVQNTKTNNASNELPDILPVINQRNHKKTRKLSRVL